MPNHLRNFLFCLLLAFLFAPSLHAELSVKEKSETYTDFNTGLKRQNVQKFPLINGKAITADDIASIINKDHPKLLTYPQIWDVFSCGPTQLFVLLSKDSQGGPYPLVSLKEENGKIKADLILDIGQGSTSNWFMDSRVEGFARVRGENRHSFLLSCNPFRVIDLQQGELAKVDKMKAFLINQYENPIKIYVHDLKTGKEEAKLGLNPSCFLMPSFSFDHPALYRHDFKEDDQDVRYNYGPKWWDKNFSYDESNHQILLKKDHVIKMPPQKSYAINYLDSESEDYLARRNGTSSSYSSSYGERENSDQILSTPIHCQKENPKGQADAINAPPQLSGMIRAESLCFHRPKEFSKATLDQRCHVKGSDTVFKAGDTEIVKIRYLYTPTITTLPAKEIDVFALKIAQNTYIYVQQNTSYTQEELIKNIYRLNDKEVLLIARGTGANHYYLLDCKDATCHLQYLDDLAYPSSPFVEIDNNRFLYQSDRGVLISKSPFAIDKYRRNLFSLKNGLAAIAYRDENGHLNLELIDYRNFEQKPLLARYQVHSSCALKMSGEIPSNGASYAEKEKWFDARFIVTDSFQIEALDKKCTLKPLNSR